MGSDLNLIRELYRRNLNIAVIVVALVLSFLFWSLSTYALLVQRVIVALGYTQWHNTRAFGRTPLDEGTARRRVIYLTTHNTLQETDLRAPGGIRTRNSSKRTTADPRLRLRGYRDRRLYYL